MTGTLAPDLTPDRPAASPTGRRPGRMRVWVAGALVAGALGGVLANGLGSATLYFRTVDEALAEADELGDRRFRLMGTVVGGTVQERFDGVEFELEEGGRSLLVVHRGDPPELFQADIPVVLEGSLAGAGRFESDRIMVKHTNEYRAENPDRVDADGAAEDPAGGRPAGSAGSDGRP